MRFTKEILKQHKTGVCNNLEDLDLSHLEVNHHQFSLVDAPASGPKALFAHGGNVFLTNHDP